MVKGELASERKKHQSAVGDNGSQTHHGTRGDDTRKRSLSIGDTREGGRSGESGQSEVGEHYCKAVHERIRRRRSISGAQTSRAEQRERRKEGRW
jgi:hypothetical protein